MTDAKSVFSSSNSQSNMGVKRVFDLLAGCILLILLCPVTVACAVLIILDSGGPVIFTHRRLGQHGKIFNCYKLRTMVVNAEDILKKMMDDDPELRKEWKCGFKLRKDPRITRVGHLLRRTSLDELPQLLNVIKGEMSLVGPRPRPVYELDASENTELFAVGLRTKPGITGLWQISGRSELGFKERLSSDAWYVHHCSIWLDCKILLKTAGVVLSKKGAY